MKATFLVLFAALLIGCDADTPAYSDADKEPGMFWKSQKKTYVISSPMDGTLMKDGKPLAHTKIIRRLRWNGNEDGVVHEFMTDIQGRFSFPAHEEELSLGRLTQFVSSTKLEAEIEGQHFDMWYNNKFEPHMYAETGGRRLDGLICDISNGKQGIDLELSRITTICRWTGMPEESEY
ncbi:MAG: DUF6795 domain-containing protein, partial [Thiohalomonadaceae bacterium]